MNNAHPQISSYTESMEKIDYKCPQLLCICMGTIYRALHYIALSFGIILLSACTSTGTSTPARITIAPSATPFPTPAALFATPTSLQDGNAQSVPTSSANIALTSAVYEGIVSSPAETAALFNGPHGAVVQQINNLAPITLLGRSDDGLWIEVWLESGISGWIRATDIDTSAPISTLKITGYIPRETNTPSPDAIVKSEGAGLRLRVQPDTDATVITNLEADTQLKVIGRTRDSDWVQVIAPNNQRGWVVSSFLTIYIDVLNLPVTMGFDSSGSTILGTPIPSGAISNITETARSIYQQGLSLGNRPAVFSKVGDSLTVATWVLYPLGWGQQNLGSYGYLQAVIDYFSGEIARNDANSFANVPLAADNQWSSDDLLNPALGDKSICAVTETPLDCEYRVVRPAFALILIGTNDLNLNDGATYRKNLSTILEKTIARSILPIISTLPDRDGYSPQVAEFNSIIRELAADYEIPIWEYGQAMANLPNRGLDADGVHPSYPPGSIDRWEMAADFTGGNLQYGYTVRNLTALQVLDEIWRRVILGE